MIDGILNVYKEQGFTSHDVVAKLRGILHQRKIGHTGTLDPDAVGVLPVCLGRATKVCDMLTDWDKTYETVLLLGKTTDTQDISGQVLAEASEEQLQAVTEEQVTEVLDRFRGTIQQIPPMYSAKKVNGKKLYDLAREGVVVERKPCTIHVSEITVLHTELPRVRLRITCSKGTYIRTLCHDIGEALGCGGCMEELTRTRVGIFPLEDAMTLEQIQKLADQGEVPKLVPLDGVFTQYEAVSVPEVLHKQLYNGGPLSVKELGIKPTEDTFRVYDRYGTFIGIYSGAETHGRALKLKKMFYNINEQVK